MIKTDLMKGNIISDRGKSPISFKALPVYYLTLPDVKRHATYKWKVNTIHKRFFPIFQNRLLKDISSGMVETFRENRRQEKGCLGSNLKTATIIRNLALLKTILGVAVREGWLERNPVSLVKMEKENNVRDRVLDPEEFERLQGHSAPHYRPLV